MCDCCDYHQSPETQRWGRRVNLMVAISCLAAIVANWRTGCVSALLIIMWNVHCLIALPRGIITKVRLASTPEFCTLSQPMLHLKNVPANIVRNCLLQSLTPDELPLPVELTLTDNPQFEAMFKRGWFSQVVDVTLSLEDDSIVINFFYKHRGRNKAMIMHIPRCKWMEFYEELSDESNS